MDKADGFVMTGVTVLLTLIVWNLFVKGFVPQPIRGWVGLG